MFHFGPFLYVRISLILELNILNNSLIITVRKQVRKVLLDPGVRTTVVTAGHCTHAAELTSGSGHASASYYSCCVHSRGLC